MNHVPARVRVDERAVSTEVIRKVVLSLFRRRRDYGNPDLSELLPELGRFGVTTSKQFRLLMKKHRRAIREDEERKMSRAKTIYFSEELGWEGLDAHACKAWFSVSGVVREAMELEFGEEARVYVE